MVTGQPNWTDLPPELLSTIGDRLENSVDVLRFRSICVSWRRSIPPHINPISPSTVELNETSVYRLQPLRNPSSPPKSWLIRVRENPETRRLKLLNPLTNDEIKPFPETIPRSIDLYHFRVTRICQFLETKQGEPVAPLYIVTGDLVVLKLLKDSLAVIKVGDENEKWNVLYRLQGTRNFCSILNFKGKVYALDSSANCIVVDSSLNITRIDNPHCNGSKYLVESRGEVLAVYKHTITSLCFPPQIPDETTNARTIGFRVYKLDREENRWIRVTNLGNRVIFVGPDCSFSVSANDFGLCKSNCIFNLDKHYDRIDETYHDEYDSLRGIYYWWEPVVFGLEDNCVRPLMSCPGYGDFFWPPPSWLPLVTRPLKPPPSIQRPPPGDRHSLPAQGSRARSSTSSSCPPPSSSYDRSPPTSSSPVLRSPARSSPAQQPRSSASTVLRPPISSSRVARPHRRSSTLISVKRSLAIANCIIVPLLILLCLTTRYPDLVSRIYYRLQEVWYQQDHFHPYYY